MSNSVLCVTVGSALGGIVEVGGTAGDPFLQLFLGLVPLSYMYMYTLRILAQKAQGWACQRRSCRNTQVNKAATLNI